MRKRNYGTFPPGSRRILDAMMDAVKCGLFKLADSWIVEQEKGYGPLVDPAPDAFPLHYRSPYVRGKTGEEEYA